MSEHVDVDPANGTEELTELVEPAAAEYDSFTAPEKIASVVQAVLANPGADPKVRGVLAALTSPLGRRLVAQPILDLLPPMDDPEEWDNWLMLLVGVALELTSDGIMVDVDEARAAAGEVLAVLFRGAG